jgi:hypothetical protein
MAFMKTSELLLLCGPAGKFLIRQTTILPEYKRQNCKLLGLMSLCKSKVSTPGDREKVAHKLPRMMTRLEMMIPITWNSAVMHILLYQTLETITDCGMNRTNLF